MSSNLEESVAVDRMAAILAESFQPGVVVAAVARKYGIPVHRLYNLRHKSRRAKNTESKSVLSGSVPPANFVELVTDNPVHRATTIEQANIVFKHCTLSIEGEISASCLADLIGIMGASC